MEAAIAALLSTALFTAFAVHDDLGRPDPVRDALPRRTAPRTTGRRRVSWRRWPIRRAAGDYGDGAGALQQRDLPPQ